MSLLIETRWSRLANFWADYRQSRVAVVKFNSQMRFKF